jgi:hypothetical protein
VVSFRFAFRDPDHGQTIVNLCQTDASATHFSFTPCVRNDPCLAGTYKVALVIDPLEQGEDLLPGNYDYHWYRQNPDGSWSHKPGLDTVRNFDRISDIVYDPQIADRISATLPHYTWFIRYFAVNPLYNVENSQMQLKTSTVNTLQNITKILNLKRADFDKIQLGMTRDEVFLNVGFPHQDLADGVYADGYYLEDGTMMGLVYLSGENKELILVGISLINIDDSVPKILP